jgi:HlyD family secretion protein
VAASYSAPTLFQIAQDLTKMQVDTNIDESDISRVQLGQVATFSVDAYPGQVFRGDVVQIRRAPINLQNVITYDVVVKVDNPEMKLFPGMTANVRIVTDRVSNALKIPASALRFRPDPVTLAAIQKAEEKTRGDAAKAEGEKAKPGDEPAKSGDGQAKSGDRFAKGGFPGGGFPGGGGQGRGGFGGGQGRGGFTGFAKGGGFGGPGSAPVQFQTIYLLGPDGQPKPMRVRVGIGDGSFIQAMSRELEEGQTIITGIASGGPTAAPTNTPGFPGAGGGRGKNFKGAFFF